MKYATGLFLDSTADTCFFADLAQSFLQYCHFCAELLAPRQRAACLNCRFLRSFRMLCPLFTVLVELRLGTPLCCCLWNAETFFQLQGRLQFTQFPFFFQSFVSFSAQYLPKSAFKALLSTAITPVVMYMLISSYTSLSCRLRFLSTSGTGRMGEML